MTAGKTIKVVVKPGAFNEVYYPRLLDEHRYQIFFGGSSSGKSFFIAQRLVLDVLRGRNYLVVRNVANTLRKSCWNEIVKSIRAMGLSGFFRVSKTEMVIECRSNGAQILFGGLDDVEKIKSITPAVGVLTDIWIEEATETDYQDFKQLDKRLRGESRFAKRVTISFNPIYKSHWLYGEFFGGWDDAGREFCSDTTSILKTTYRDNRFLTDDDRAALESEKDPYYREVYTEGNWGVLGDVIFRNWRVEDLSELHARADKVYMGLDFGFSSDPCGFVRAQYDAARKRIYVLDEVYERGLTNPALARAIAPICGRGYVTCDSAEPKSIAELKQHGIRALPARKGPDSVLYGIQWLQQHEIIVDVHCQHMKNELTLYQWRKDKDGNSLRAPVDRDNHLIDALRYATESLAERREASTNAGLRGYFA